MFGLWSCLSTCAIFVLSLVTVLCFSLVIFQLTVVISCLFLEAVFRFGLCPIIPFSKPFVFSSVLTVGYLLLFAPKISLCLVGIHYTCIIWCSYLPHFVHLLFCSVYFLVSITGSIHYDCLRAKQRSAEVGNDYIDRK